MTESGRSTVVGVFERREDADRAVEELRRAGFRDDSIGFAVRGGEVPEGTSDVGQAGAGEGAAAGMLTGGVLGGLIGAAASGLIPGIGPVIAGGILATVLGGAVVGAAAGGMLGALMGLGVPEEEARYYQGEFEAGRTIVTVKANGRYSEADEILRSYGAYDVHRGSITQPVEDGTMESSMTETTAIGTAADDSTPHRQDAAARAADQAYLRRHESDAATHESVSDRGRHARPWDEVAPTYQDAWERQYGTSGRRWHEEESGYRFGYEMSQDPRFRDRDWSDAENDLKNEYTDWSHRRGYRSDDDNPWDRVRESARNTWEAMRERRSVS